MASPAFNDLKAAVDGVVSFVAKLKADNSAKVADLQAQLDAANADLANRDADLVPLSRQLQDIVAAG